MKIFTYSIPYDTGYAPSPYHGLCTLNTCKPQIRREASVGDWVVGLKRDFVIYAMEVTEKISMKAYWIKCKKELPEKIPKKQNLGISHPYLYGDCQYDFSVLPPLQIPGFHKSENYDTDLSGKYTLLSSNFIYFGKNAVKLPGNLTNIAKYSNGKWLGVARKSVANNPYIIDFLEWFNAQKSGVNTVNGEPFDI